MTENTNQAELLTPNNNNGGVVPHAIEGELSESYISYAMSVIVARALPDVRDGMKPVHRRILYAMQNMRLTHTSKYKKSASVVGEVLGKYHPHGDSSVYDAMVRLAQPFSMRYPLVDGQGNFGSVDGDGAAAMRYTEARLTKIAEQMMADLDQDTVDRRDNYDGSEQEPVMLSTKFPNHLCNGTMGIAVGMATNMAPHNLTEVIDALLLTIANPEVTIDEIMDIIQGPDFPTKGVIFDPANIREVYRKGKGGIVMRGVTHTEVQKNGTTLLVIDEIPYQVNKSNLVAKIGQLVVDKKIEGVTDITDESNKDAMRITITLRQGIDPDTVLMLLYKSTDLQCNFNINNVTLIEGGIQPRMLNIKDLLTEYIDFRKQVVERRSKFQLEKAQNRLHILKKAVDIIDEVIALIRASSTKEEAKNGLMEKFEFSEVQAEYILQMRLQSLVGLEIQKIIDEIEEKKAQIAALLEILNNPARRDEVIVEELNEMKDKYGDERWTKVSPDTSVYNLSGSLKALKDAADRVKEDIILWIDNQYQVKVLYQTRIQTISEDTLEMVYTHNQDKLIIITDKGELVVERLKDLGSHKTSGPAIDLAKHFDLKGNIVFARTIENADYKYLTFLTTHNNIKKIKKGLVLSFKKFPTIVMNLPGKGERIVAVTPVIEGDKLAIVSKQGVGLIFDESDIRPMGKTAGGVKAIDLASGDKIAHMCRYYDEPFLMIHDEKNAKLLNVADDLRIRRRGRRGDSWVSLESKQTIMGIMAVVEGNVRIRLDNDEIETYDINKMYLADPDASLDKLTKHSIAMAYRPWEEFEENMKYKEEKKQKEKEEAAKLLSTQPAEDNPSDSSHDA
jgi:DNA gyrase subunit A